MTTVAVLIRPAAEGLRPARVANWYAGPGGLTLQGMANTTREYSKLPSPWDRIFCLGTRSFVWAVFLAVLYILRPFFLTVFLTFVFA